MRISSRPKRWTIQLLTHLLSTKMTNMMDWGMRQHLNSSMTISYSMLGLLEDSIGKSLKAQSTAWRTDSYLEALSWIFSKSLVNKEPLKIENRSQRAKLMRSCFQKCPSKVCWDSFTSLEKLSKLLWIWMKWMRLINFWWKTMKIMRHQIFPIWKLVQMWLKSISSLSQKDQMREALIKILQEIIFTLQQIRRRSQAIKTIWMNLS